MRNGEISHEVVHVRTNVHSLSCSKFAIFEPKTTFYYNFNIVIVAHNFFEFRMEIHNFANYHKLFVFLQYRFQLGVFCINGKNNVYYSHVKV